MISVTDVRYAWVIDGVVVMYLEPAGNGGTHHFIAVRDGEIGERYADDADTEEYISALDYGELPEWV